MEERPFTTSARGHVSFFPGAKTGIVHAYIPDCTLEHLGALVEWLEHDTDASVVAIDLAHPMQSVTTYEYDGHHLKVIP